MISIGHGVVRPDSDDFLMLPSRSFNPRLGHVSIREDIQAKGQSTSPFL